MHSNKINFYDQRPKFCSVPWKEIYMGPTGTYGVCCFEKEDPQTTRTTLDETVENYKNGHELRTVRQSFMSGELSDRCNKCWQDESHGLVSGRMRRNQRYYGKEDLRLGDPEIAETLLDTRPDGHTNEITQGLHFYVGNTCQLRCIDCSPSFSRNILKDYKKFNWDENFKTRKETRSLDLVHNNQKHMDNLWTRVREIAQQINWLTISGGEPTLSTELLNFLSWFNDQGLAKETSVLLSTNCVNVKENFIKALKPFRMVKLGLSVDGVGSLDEYLRYPTNWEKKQLIVDRLLAEFPGSIINTTVYNLNVGGLANLIKWAQTKPAELSLLTLTYPNELQMQNLPEDYKQQITKDLLPYAQQYAAVDSMINQLRQPCDPEAWNQTKQIITSYNQIRPRPLQDILPDLSKFIE
jgi:organic radical activating enzyme